MTQKNILSKAIASIIGLPVIGLVAALTSPVYALEALEDGQMHQVTGQTGLALQIDDLKVQVVDDPSGDPDNYIELKADDGLSIVATDLYIGGPDDTGWSIGSVADPVFISVPKIERLTRNFVAGTGYELESYPILSLATPSYQTTQNQPGVIEATVNIYDPNQPQSYSYDLNGDLVDDVTYYGLNHNPLRASLRGITLNGAQLGPEISGENLDPYRITHVNVWAQNGDLNITGRVNLSVDAVDITPGFDIDLGDASTFGTGAEDLGDLTGYRKTDYSVVGYAAPTGNNYADPSAPDHNGIAIRGLEVDLALGRTFYQPLTLSIASTRGDIKLELAQIPGGQVCQSAELEADTCSYEAGINDIDAPINQLAKDFYSDPLSRSTISFDNAYINGYELGGGLIKDLRIHYLNVTTCASATSVATCN